MIVLLLLLFAGSALLDVPSIVRGKEWKTLVVYGAVFALSVVLGVVQYNGVQIPSPLDALYTFTSDWLGLGYRP